MRKPIAVYILDDEALVIEGVSKMINQAFPGFVVCGSAQNGAKALEEIPLLGPDLILVDINMPGLSGIDVIKELRFLGIEVTVALLTAYERFDIAKSAFGLGVSSYILKPVTQRKLDETLPNLEIEIRKKQELQRQFRHRAQSEGNTRELLVSAYLYFSFLGKEESALDYFEASGLGNQEYTFVHCRFLPEDRPKVKQKLQDLGFVQEILGRNLLSGRLFFLVNGSKASELLQWIHAQNCPGSWEALALSPPNNPFRALRRPGSSDDFPQKEPLDIELFYAGDLLGLRTRVLSLAELFSTDSPFLLTSQLCAYGARLLGSIAERLGSLPMDLEGFFQDMLAQGQMEELVEAFLARIHLWRLYFLEHQTLSDLVMRAKAYLTRDLGANVEEIATALGVSLAHLSRQFSSEMGLSMTQYATNLRIGKAKQLLSEGILPIKEIAGLCGFSDSGYFSKVFKKHCGISPKSYQKGGEEPPLNHRSMEG